MSELKGYSPLPAISKNAKYITIFLFVIGGAVRLWIAFQPISELEYKIIPDDSFYYFQTARHIAAGNGSTFDGTSRHNGYHPLWMILMLPIYAAVPDDISQPGPMSAIRAIMLLGIALDLAAAYFVFLIAAYFTKSANLAILAAALRLLDPYAVMHSVDGLETPLLGLMIAAALFASKSQIMGTPMTKSRSAILGVLLGLLMLSRTDAVFFAGTLLIVLLFAAQNKRAAFVKIFRAGVIASIIVMPWLLFSKLYIGTWGQSSSDAAPYVSHVAFVHYYGASEGIPWLHGIRNQIRFALSQGLHLSPLGFLILPSAAIFMMWMFFGKRRTRWILLFIAPTAYCLSLFVIHAGWRWMVRDWYFAPLYLFISIFVPMLLSEAIVKFPGLKNIAPIIFGLAITVSFAVKGYGDWQTGLWPAQKGGMKAAGDTRKMLPAGTKIGSTDAGVAGYFGPPGLVNLDGVVNESARRAILDGRLLQYCIDNGITVVGIRERMQIPEIMGGNFQLYLYPGPLGYLEIRKSPYEMPKRFAPQDGIIKPGEIEFAKYLLSGWSRPETENNISFSWATAETASIVAAFPENTATMEITLKPFLHAKCPQRKMDVIIDDELVASFDLQQGWQKLFARIGNVKKMGIIKFRFTPPPDYSFSAAGIKNDLRKPAAAFHSIRIY